MTKRTDMIILVADSDADLRYAICQTLESDGYDTLEANNAQRAIHVARHNRPDVIIVDASLPDMNGFEVCTRMRALPFVTDTPILFLGTYDHADYIAQALDCGGDDYLRKPFAMTELSARIRALGRRTARRQFHDLSTLRLDPMNHGVYVDHRKVELTPTEFSLLEHLTAYPEDHHTANSLLETLWQYPPGDGDTALVRNHIRNLRRKIEDNPDQPRIIISMHGRGYTVNARVINTTSHAQS